MMMMMLLVMTARLPVLVLDLFTVQPVLFGVVPFRLVFGCLDALYGVLNLVVIGRGILVCFGIWLQNKFFLLRTLFGWTVFS